MRTVLGGRWQPKSDHLRTGLPKLAQVRSHATLPVEHRVADTGSRYMTLLGVPGDRARPSWMTVAWRRTSRAWVVARRLTHCPEAEAGELKAGDRQIARNRLLFGLAAAAYTYLLLASEALDSALFAVIAAAYLVLATSAFFVARIITSLGPEKSDLFRKAMLLIDVSALSSVATVSGQEAAPLLFLYFWVTIGYGFRYGIYYLRFAAATSLCGIFVALIFTDFWRKEPLVTTGILLLTMVIPCYLELLMRRAIRANEMAKTANHSKALLLAGLGHALRVPLNSISSAAQALSKSVLDPTQGQMLGSIQVAAGSLVREIDDLLDVSRLDAGRMPKEVTSFNVKGLITEALAIAGAPAASKSIATNWFISPEVPERIWSERRYLLKSLTGILENAVKFTSVGSVLVTAYMVKTAANGQCLQIEVSDTGMGVQPQARERIFESFSQASPEILHIFGGAGLGLSVARRMIESLGGAVGVDSADGQGSRFWIRLPVLAAEAMTRSTDSLAGTLIVILSSSIDGLLPFAERLERLGAATFLTERVDLWDAIPADDPGVIKRVVVIVDGRSTDMSELGLALQNNRVLGRVPVIAMTARDGLPEISIRRRFVTAISPAVSDEHLQSSLHLVGAFTQELKMEARSSKQGNGPSSPQSSNDHNRVLIADTNRTSVLILSKILDQAGHRCTIVDCGEGALDAAERELFDIIFMDVDKPKIGGLESVRMLRFQEMGGMHRSAIFGLTGNEDSESIARCKEAGCDDVVVRPIDMKKVLDLVARSLSQRLESMPAIERPGGSIRPISSHPRFRATLGPAIADETFPYLQAIGGAPFVEEVLTLFISDTEHALARLREDLERDDLASFTNGVLSLGESGTVIGATRLIEMCRTSSVLGKDRLSLSERALLANLDAEVARVVVRIRNSLDGSVGPGGTKPGGA